MRSPIVDAERALAAGLVCYPAWAPSALAVATPADFDDPKCAAVAEAVRGLSQARAWTDPETVRAALSAQGTPVAQAAADQLDALLFHAQLTSGEALDALAQRVRDAADLRRVRAVAAQLERAATDPGAKAADVLAEAQRLYTGLGQARATGFGSSGLELALALDARLDGVEPTLVVATGLTALDALLDGGLAAGQLFVVGGRPKMGKSSLVGNWTLAAALRGTDTLVFTHEMTRHEYYERWVCDAADLNHAELRAMQRRPGGYAEQRTRVAMAQQRLGREQLHVEDARLTVHEVRARCLAHRMRRGSLGLVVVDYLQLLREPQGGRSDRGRERAVAEMSSELKALAKELACPVLALSQLNRDCETRPDKRPRMADLRESGSLEQDADVVLFVYRDEVYNKDSDDRGIAELIVAARRGGETGTLKVRWRGDRYRFEDLPDDYARDAAPSDRGGPVDLDEWETVGDAQ